MFSCNLCLGASAQGEWKSDLSTRTHTDQTHRWRELNVQNRGSSTQSGCSNLLYAKAKSYSRESASHACREMPSVLLPASPFIFPTRHFTVNSLEAIKLINIQIYKQVCSQILSIMVRATLENAFQKFCFRLLKALVIQGLQANHVLLSLPLCQLVYWYWQR